MACLLDSVSRLVEASYITSRAKAKQENLSRPKILPLLHCNVSSRAASHRVLPARRNCYSVGAGASVGWQCILNAELYPLIRIQRQPVIAQGCLLSARRK